MNYIYDIYLNFNKIYYDFYEWNKSDKIIHIKKIPILKIDTPTFKKIITHRFVIDEQLFSNIKNKTEIYNKKDLLTCLIITDSKNVLAYKFDSKGETISLSSLLLDDEFDILEYSLKSKENDFKCKLRSRYKYFLSTRKEIDEKKYVLNKLYKLSYDTLKYIYYDCFDKEETDTNIMLKELVREIHRNNLINTHIYNILKPVSTN